MLPEQRRGYYYDFICEQSSWASHIFYPRHMHKNLKQNCEIVSGKEEDEDDSAEEKRK